jgi:hypothetical protein
VSIRVVTLIQGYFVSVIIVKSVKSKDKSHRKERAEKSSLVKFKGRT